jgi:uncharacterized membrane-anchored protein YhcB (DUF1043 family)
MIEFIVAIIIGFIVLRAYQDDAEDKARIAKEELISE